MNKQCQIKARAGGTRKLIVSQFSRFSVKQKQNAIKYYTNHGLQRTTIIKYLHETNKFVNYAVSTVYFLSISSFSFVWIKVNFN